MVQSELDFGEVYEFKKNNFDRSGAIALKSLKNTNYNIDYILSKQ